MAAEARRTGDQGLPKRMGRYEAFLQIGAGGMARVYLAVQRAQPGKKAELVVVKVLRPEVVEDEHVVSLFTDEARIAMRLEHPNVIRTREVVAAPPDYVLAMDFHEGRSLLDILNRIGRDAVPLDEHIYVLTKVLAGLSYAHEAEDDEGRSFGIVHRDVSPANVLVSYTGEVKLLDFGIAKASGALAATRDGVVRGKLGYAAPEQCLGQPADPRSDIYAVGVMLWEAIAGRRRVSGETWQSILQARLDDAEPALEEVCPDAPRELAAIVNKALARNPGDRYSTAKEFQADLESYLVAKPGAAMTPARITAMLKPHFARDRAELRRAIREFVESRRRRGKPAQVGRVPPPEASTEQATETPETSRHTVPTLRDENTAPIPVNSALLMLTRDANETAPNSGIPTVPPPGPSTPTVPPRNSSIPTVPPANSATTTTPPSVNSATTTAPLPADAVVTAPSAPPAALASMERDSSAEHASSSVAATDGVATTVNVAAPSKASPLEVAPFGVVVAQTVASAPAWASSTDSAVPPKKKKPLVAFLFLAAGVIAIFAVVAVRVYSDKSAGPAPASTGVTKPARPVATTASSAPKIEMVKVRISVDPSDAILTLDGRELEGNPFVATLPKDNAEHQLVAVAEACKEHSQTIRFSGDRSLLVAMKCKREGLRIVPRPRKRHPVTADSATAAASAFASTEAATAASAPASAESTVNP